MIPQYNTLIRKKECGIALIEALIGILLFSFAVLALVGLQAASISHTRDAKYRADAAFLAEQIIGVMWADRRAHLASYAHSPTGSNCSFSGAASTNANVTTWLGDATTAGTVIGTLPGAAAVTTGTGPSASITRKQQISVSSNQVTVTICWQAPQDPVPHSYTTLANISGGL